MHSINDCVSCGGGGGEKGSRSEANIVWPFDHLGFVLLFYCLEHSVIYYCQALYPRIEFQFRLNPYPSQPLQLSGVRVLLQQILWYYKYMIISNSLLITYYIIISYFSFSFFFPYHNGHWEYARLFSLVKIDFHTLQWKKWHSLLWDSGT